jgi:hypothetical protein
VIVSYRYSSGHSWSRAYLNCKSAEELLAPVGSLGLSPPSFSPSKRTHRIKEYEKHAWKRFE